MKTGIDGLRRGVRWSRVREGIFGVVVWIGRATLMAADDPSGMICSNGDRVSRRETLLDIVDLVDLKGD